MKKLLIYIFLVFAVMIASAQDCYLPISITMQDSTRNQDFKPVEAILRRVLSSENITASKGSLFDVSICPEEVTSETITGIRPTVTVFYDIILTVYNTVSNEQFYSTSIRLQGSGKNATTARKAAARSLKADNVALISFVRKARRNIVDYYDNNLDVILSQAKQAMELRQLEKSMWFLSSIPACIGRYNEVIDFSTVIFNRYLTLDCQEKISKAQLAWTASPDQEGALLAFSYLAGVDRESTCNEEAQKLVSEIKDAITKTYSDNKEIRDSLLTLEMELKRSEIENEKARIEAMRAIGVAYGKNQPKKEIKIDNN